MALIMTISTVLTVLNLILILALVVAYAKNLSKIKSPFTIGLFLFAVIFLLQNFLYIYFHITMMPLYTASAELFVFLLTILQTIAFSILNGVTWR